MAVVSLPGCVLAECSANHVVSIFFSFCSLLSIVFLFSILLFFLSHLTFLSVSCGMCHFVQLKLDCLLPGGERVMVLLSSHSEIDSYSRAGV